jgi:competence protein ComFC
MSRKSYQLAQWLWASVDWFFLPVCGGCNRTGFRWCTDCQQKVKLVPEPTCQICGYPITRLGLCLNCREVHPPYHALRSWAIYEGPIRNALLSLKYRRNLTLGDTLARYLAKFVRELGWQVDMVVPVPLGKQRMKERGYNQVELLARPLSYLQDWCYSPQALGRVRETRSQVGLSALERKENIFGAFYADPALATGKNILVLDDITTTGSTLAACSEALSGAGAKIVYALTLARALPQHGLQIA